MKYVRASAMLHVMHGIMWLLCVVRARAVLAMGRLKQECARVHEDLGLLQRTTELLQEMDSRTCEALARHARVRREETQHHGGLPHREGGSGHRDRALVALSLVVQQNRVRMHVIDHLQRG